MESTLQVVLRGDKAVLGEVLASDVARLLGGAERAVARAAERVIGRQPRRSGRRTSVVEAATRFRLRAITSGSVTAVLELPADETTSDDGLDLGDATLGELAVRDSLVVISGQVNDPYIADALAGLGEELGLGDRYEKLEFEFRTHEEVFHAVIDREAKETLRRVARASPGPIAPSHLVGTLVEADFESRTARLRTSARDAVRVSFEEGLAEEIRSALRRQADLEGIVRYDQEAGRAVSVELRSITRTEQLMINPDEIDFWSAPTLEALAEAQGVDPITRAELLRDQTEIDEEELDTFFSTLEI